MLGYLVGVMACSARSLVYALDVGRYVFLTVHSPLAYFVSLDLVFVASTVDRVLHTYSLSSLPALKCVSTVA